MPVIFNIPGYLSTFTGGRDRVELTRTPATVGGALEALTALYPGVRDRLMNEQGEVRQHINVFVGTESIQWSGGLATPLSDGAEVTIVPAVSGG